MKSINTIETTILLLITKIGVWLTPLVPALFVQRAMVAELNIPASWGWIAAAALEIVGIGATKSLVTAYTWNQEKRKSDPAAPLGWYIASASIYYATALLIVLIIEFYPVATRIVPASFVILSGNAALVIALAADHKRRQQTVSAAVADRSKKRSANRQPTGPADHESTVSDRLIAGKRRSQLDAERRLLTFLKENPDTSHGRAARVLGDRSRPWVTGKINEWEEQGIVSKNGEGYKINE